MSKTSMRVDYLVGEHHIILVIEGHVDLAVANTAFLQEGNGDFPEAKHDYMRWADVPEGEFQDSWRAICDKDAEGAEPVTVSVLDW